MLCSYFDSFKNDLREEKKKEMDEQLTKIDYKNHMFQKYIIELKEANIKLQNETNELEQMASAYA